MAAAKKRASKTVSFANGNGAVLSIPAAEAYLDTFRVRRHVKDRVSQPVLLTAIHFDEKAREIRVFGDDGQTRKCKVDRLPTIEQGRQLFRTLQKAGTAKKPVQFVAAGGYSPDVWFYTVK